MAGVESIVLVTAQDSFGFALWSVIRKSPLNKLVFEGSRCVRPELGMLHTF